MQQVRDFGRYPKASKDVVSRERRLAEKLRKARKEKLLSPEQESELKALQRAQMDSRVAAGIAEAEEPPNSVERFAGESQSRIEQDLLMLESGIGTKELLRRLVIYKKLVFRPSVQHEEFARRYAERVGQASVSVGKRRYVPSTEVDGGELSHCQKRNR